MGESFHVNEYITNRAYGGPEEDGWWYGTGEFVKCHGTVASFDEAEAICESLRGYLDESHEAEKYGPNSMLCAGWTVILVEDRPGTDYPAFTPRYE